MSYQSRTLRTSQRNTSSASGTASAALSPAQKAAATRARTKASKAAAAAQLQREQAPVDDVASEPVTAAAGKKRKGGKGVQANGPAAKKSKTRKSRAPQLVLQEDELPPVALKLYVDGTKGKAKAVTSGHTGVAMIEDENDDDDDNGLSPLSEDDFDAIEDDDGDELAKTNPTQFQRQVNLERPTWLSSANSAASSSPSFVPIDPCLSRLDAPQAVAGPSTSNTAPSPPSAVPPVAPVSAPLPPPIPVSVPAAVPSAAAATTAAAAPSAATTAASATAAAAPSAAAAAAAAPPAAAAAAAAAATAPPPATAPSTALPVTAVDAALGEQVQVNEDTTGAAGVINLPPATVGGEFPENTNLVLGGPHQRMSLRVQSHIVQLGIRGAFVQIIYEILLVHGFPDATLSETFSRNALIRAASLRDVCIDMHRRLLQEPGYINRLIPLPIARIGIFRLKFKESSDNHIVGMYNLLPEGEQSQAAVAFAVRDYNYIFRRNSPDGLTGAVRRGQPYRHPIGITILHQTIFAKGIPDGFRDRLPFTIDSVTNERRIELPKAMVALAFTAVYASLHERRSGHHVKSDFSAGTYLDVYGGHIATLNEMENTRPPFYHSFMSGLYTAALTGPLSVLPAPGVPAALIDYNDE